MHVYTYCPVEPAPVLAVLLPHCVQQGLSCRAFARRVPPSDMIKKRLLKKVNNEKSEYQKSVFFIMQSFADYLKAASPSPSVMSARPHISVTEKAREAFFEEHKQSIQKSIGKMPPERQDDIIQALWQACPNKSKYMDAAAKDQTTEDLFDMALVYDDDTFGEYSTTSPTQTIGSKDNVNSLFVVKPIDTWPEHLLDGLFVCSTHLPTDKWDKNNLSHSERIALALKIMQMYVSETA